jgi:hypothetical protein
MKQASYHRQRHGQWSDAEPVSDAERTQGTGDRGSFVSVRFDGYNTQCPAAVRTVVPDGISLRASQRVALMDRLTLRTALAASVALPAALVSDVAAAVAYLASPAAGYVTGAVLHVNGGMYMS